MVSKYNLLKELKENGIFLKLLHAGIIDLSTATQLQIYEYYLLKRKENKKARAISLASEYFKFSESHIYLIIRNMELT